MRHKIERAKMDTIQKTVEIGKTYKDIGGRRMLVLRDVPAEEVGRLVDPTYDYVEVAFADQPDHADGWRRKCDGRYPLYAHWPQHSCHLILETGK